MLIPFRTLALLFECPSGMHLERGLDALIANLRRCTALCTMEGTDEGDASFIRGGFSEDNMWGHEWQNNGLRIRMEDKVCSRRFKRLCVTFCYCKLLFPMQAYAKTAHRMAVVQFAPFTFANHER